MRRGIYLSIFFLHYAFSSNCQEVDFWSAEWKTINGEKIILSKAKAKGKALIFLSPECPLCQNYTLTLNEIKQNYPEISFLGVFAGDYYSKKEIRQFISKYEIDFDCIIDEEFRIAKNLSASTTPEVFLFDSDLQKIYQGAIDNWAPELGKKRKVITEKYLEAALDHLCTGTSLVWQSTEAIGCKIQF